VFDQAAQLCLLIFTMANVHFCVICVTPGTIVTVPTCYRLSSQIRTLLTGIPLMTKANPKGLFTELEMFEMLTRCDKVNT